MEDKQVESTANISTDNKDNLDYSKRSKGKLKGLHFRSTLSSLLFGFLAILLVVNCIRLTQGVEPMTFSSFLFIMSEVPDLDLSAYMLHFDTSSAIGLLAQSFLGTAWNYLLLAYEWIAETTTFVVTFLGYIFFWGMI